MTYLITVKKNKDFKKIYASGRSVSNDSLVLYVRRNKVNIDRRFGFSVGKKIGKAVVRNRIKRLLKEACRLNMEYFPRENDYIIVARKTAAQENYHTLSEKLLLLVKRITQINKFSNQQKVMKN